MSDTTNDGAASGASKGGGGKAKLVWALIIGLFLLSVYREVTREKVDHPHGEGHWSLMNYLPEQMVDNLGHAAAPSLMGDTHVHVTHVFTGLLALLIGLGLALSAGARLKRETQDSFLLPPKRWSPLAFFDVIIEMLLKQMEAMMPRKDALAALPLITGFAVFILISNAMGLIPGLLPPTDNLNTTAALACLAFLAYNYWGFKKQGLKNYLAHFAGPVWWLAWFMFPLEIISHLARPLSLSVRLMGNMFGDHLVLGVILGFHLLMLPLPVMVLGMVVVLVQTAVFTLLAIVYILLAVEEHEHEHEDHGHGAEAHAH